LKTGHTLKHYKERWYPNLFERNTYESWLRDGGKTLAERASDKVDRILSEHEPEPLPPKIKERLQGIVQKTQTKGLI
jgi:trimethylamine--corrinoid protein Co-methyltransferase